MKYKTKEALKFSAGAAGVVLIIAAKLTFWGLVVWALVKYVSG